MSLIGHWMALDAGASGTTLPDRSASGADGTLSASCTWVNVGLPPEAAVRCPSGHKVSIPDDARWDGMDEGIFLCRLIMIGSYGTNPGWISQSQGSGFVPKWVHHINTDFSGFQHAFYVNNGSNSNQFTRSGVQWNPLISAVVHSVALKRKINGGNYDHTWYHGAAVTATTTGTAAMSGVAASLYLGYGGESYFDGDMAIVAARLYDDPDDLNDAGVLAALLEDAEESLGIGAAPPSSGAPFSRIYLGM